MSDFSLPEEIVREIDALIDAEFSKAPAPGVAVGIVRDGKAVAFRSRGVTDLETGDLPAERSIARVASVTKTFTATAIMQLRDASLLELDDPLLLHIPEFTNAQAIAAPLEEVTVRRLLTHHSGLSTEHPDLDWDTPEFPTREHVMDSLELLQVVIPEDSQWKYSNLAYSLLGEVISRLSGKPYADYVHEAIIAPLGLQNTTFDLSAEQERLKMTGYSPALPGESGFRPAPYGHLRGFSAAGQLHTNIEDLAMWIDFQLGNGPEQVLATRSRKEMQRPIYVDDDWSSGQCLGWRAVRKGEHVFHNHGGAVHGFSTSVVFNVPAKTGVIVLANVWPNSWTADLSLSIAGKVTESLAASTDSKPVPAGDDSIANSEFSGQYFAEPGLPLSITANSRGLSFVKPQPGESSLHAPATLENTQEEDAFRVKIGRGAGELAVFQRDDSGTVTGFMLGGFKYRKVN